MPLSSYSELQTSVKAWAARADANFGTQVPDFIRLAEERIWKNLRCSDMISAPLVLTVPEGLNYVALPDDWLAFSSLQADRVPNVELQPMAVIRTLYPGGDDAVYGIEGRFLYYGQLGAAGGTGLTATYYKHPGFLADVSTTWLLDKYPTAYLMGALWAGMTYLKNPQAAADYDGKFLAALDGIISQDKAAMISGGPLRRRGPGLT